MLVNSKLTGCIFNFEINLKFAFGQMKETRKNSLRSHHPDFIQTEATKMKYDGTGILPLLPASKALISFELAA